MKGSRRAVPEGARPASAAVFGGVIVGLATALVSASGVLAFVAARIGRRAIEPAARIADLRLLDVDTASQTVRITRNADTELPGRYGLFTSGTQSYLKIGTVLSTDAAGVTRKLLTEVGPTDRLAAEAAFSGWYFRDPEELHLPFTEVEVPTSLGGAPAWLFPTEDHSGVWAIHVHGRGTTRSECLRAIPTFRSAGLTSLIVSYRNDGEAPATREGTYALGATEWRDVDAAIELALSRGARRIVLVGWSMGGAIALQTALNSAHGDVIAGLILDSPVIDWRTVLGHHARALGVPRPVTGLALGALTRGWSSRLSGAEDPIPLDDLDLVTRAAELRHPTLILHSSGDDFVPSGASQALAAARADLVDLEQFEVARHTKLWNYDEDRWTGAIRSWLERQGLTSGAVAGS
ncbi:alpha/beta hydrolase family protein [Microbacterium sp.]|uniref:alpha/beta hydrolase family protein n=1 Tax=Microbacterium sp. TaxID=51671 RepID=UPI003736269D